MVDGQRTDELTGDAARAAPAARVARLLRELATGPPDRGVRELARTLGVGKSTVHRLLQSLAAEGLLDHDPVRGTYALGPGMYQLGMAAGDPRLLAASGPVLEDLCRRSGQTVQLAVRDGRDALYLRRASRCGPGPFSAVPRRLPAHCTSSGKVLLADLPPAELAELFPGGRLPAMTRRSITTRAGLVRELSVTRERGWAMNVGECRLGFASVGAPIRGADGRVLAGVSIAAPAERFVAAGPDRYVGLVRSAARLISRRLPLTGPLPAARG